MDGALTQAVLRGDVDAVRRRLAEVDRSCFGATDRLGNTILHLAARRGRRHLDAVLLIVEAMDKEQLGVVNGQGQTAVGLLTHVFEDRAFQNIALALARKIPERVFRKHKHTMLPNDRLQRPLLVVGALLDRFGEEEVIFETPEENHILRVLRSYGEWTLTEEEVDVFLRLIEAAPLQQLQVGYYGLAQLVRDSCPPVVIKRILERHVEEGAEPVVATARRNLLHDIAQHARPEHGETLLDAVLPFMKPDHLFQKCATSVYDCTPAEMARRKHQQQPFEWLQRAAAMLTPLTKSAAI
mmetsp:Transcript_1628/g.5767  ORF Transcript_1628/g.5767 Transcript_1628/m.5767 type:complete len:297 (+) Transcript_1628:3-893(+)